MAPVHDPTEAPTVEEEMEGEEEDIGCTRNTSKIRIPMKKKKIPDQKIPKLVGGAVKFFCCCYVNHCHRLSIHYCEGYHFTCRGNSISSHLSSCRTINFHDLTPPASFLSFLLAELGQSDPMFHRRQRRGYEGDFDDEEIDRL